MAMLLKRLKRPTIYMQLCGNNTLKLYTVHSSMAYYVHILLYNAAEHISLHYIVL
jgi:hypothetical protein